MFIFCFVTQNMVSKAVEFLKQVIPTRTSLVLLGALGIGTPGCTLVTEGEGWPSEDKAPVTEQASSDYKIPPTTKVLGPEGIAQLETVTNEGKLVFPTPSSYAQHLEEGDIVIAGVSEKTPYGLLRRITDVTRDAHSIDLQTIPASLEEAVEEGTLRTHIDFSKAYLDTPRINANTETRTDALRGELHEEGTMKIDFGNTELTSGIEVNGYAQLTVGVDVEIEIKQFTLEHFKLGVTGNEKLALEFIAAYERAYEKELPPVEPIPLKPFTIWAWGIPIVIFPHYSVTLGFEAGAKIDLSAAIEQEARAEVGLVYDKETGFAPVSDFQNGYHLLYDPDFVGITGRGELFVKHKLLFAPYNIGGVFVSFRGGVGAEVSLEELVVYANLGVGAGAELKALRRKDTEEGGRESEGEGDEEEMEYPPVSIEIPLYSHREDLLRKRWGGSEEESGEGESELQNICGKYLFMGEFSEEQRGCEWFGLEWTEEDIWLNVNEGIVVGRQTEYWNYKDPRTVNIIGTLTEEGEVFFASELRDTILYNDIGTEYDCLAKSQTEFFGQLDSSVISGSYTITISDIHGGNTCGDMSTKPATCKYTITGSGNKVEPLQECDPDNCFFRPERRVCEGGNLIVYDGCGEQKDIFRCGGGCEGGECRGDGCGEQHYSCVDERTLRRTDNCGNILETIDCERWRGEGYRCVEGRCFPPQRPPAEGEGEPAEGEGEPAEGEGQENGTLHCGFTYGNRNSVLRGVPGDENGGFLLNIVGYMIGSGFDVDLDIQGNNATAVFQRRGDDPISYTYHGTLNGRNLRMTSLPTILRSQQHDCTLTHESTWTGTLTPGSSFGREFLDFAGREVAQWYDNRGTYCPDDPAIVEHMETGFENNLHDEGFGDECE